MTIPIAMPVAHADEGDGAAWSIGLRVGFRFAFLYVLLFALPFPLYGEPWTIAVLGPLLDPIVVHLPNAAPWVQRVVFHYTDTATRHGFGGDDVLAWATLLLNLFYASLGTVVWSIVSRRASEHRMAAGALRVYVRYFLASMMFAYGFVKLFPAQFGSFGGDQLSVPVGELSPMALLWTFMSYSPGYTIFTGVLEVAGGALLLSRRTAMVGGLVVAGVMANVFAMNVFYDVSVKLGSLHYLLFAVALVATDGRRLADALVLGRPTEAVTLVPRTVPTRIVKALLIVLLVVPNLSQAWSLHRKSFGSSRALSGVYAVDGDPHIARIGVGALRLRIVPTGTGISHTLLLRDDGADGIELSAHRGSPEERLAVTDLGGGRFRLDGTLEGAPVSLTLTPVAMPLASGGIHWIDR